MGVSIGSTAMSKRQGTLRDVVATVNQDTNKPFANSKPLTMAAHA